MTLCQLLTSTRRCVNSLRDRILKNHAEDMSLQRYYLQGFHKYFRILFKCILLHHMVGYLQSSCLIPCGQAMSFSRSLSSRSTQIWCTAFSSQIPTFCPKATAGPCRPSCPKVRMWLENAVRLRLRLPESTIIKRICYSHEGQRCRHEHPLNGCRVPREHLSMK